MFSLTKYPYCSASSIHFIRIQVFVIDTALNHVKDIDKPPANQWMITIGWIPVRQDHMGMLSPSGPVASHTGVKLVPHRAHSDSKHIEGISEYLGKRGNDEALGVAFDQNHPEKRKSRRE